MNNNKSKKKFPVYAIRCASNNYSNIATVLAGFAFASIILLAQQKDHDVSKLINWATIAFLLAFFGCILSSFSFAVISGEEEKIRRSHAMALFAGGSFAVSIMYVLWGLVLVVKIFFSSTILKPAYWVFVSGAIIAPMYLVLSAIDPIIAFEDNGNSRSEPIKFPIKDFLPYCVIGYLPHLLVFIKLVDSTHLTCIADSPRLGLIYFSLILIIVGAAVTLFISVKDPNYTISKIIIGSWIFLNSCIYAMLYYFLL